MTITHTLTPTQFVVARMLAKAYGHPWADVSDGTYNLEEICAWCQKQIQFTHALKPGFDTPALDEKGNIVYSASYGSLVWIVTPGGNVTLQIHQDDKMVAQITILNGYKRGKTEHFTFGEMLIGTSKKNMCYDQDGKIVSGWEHIPSLSDTILFAHHVADLLHPLETLLTLHEYQTLLYNIKNMRYKDPEKARSQYFHKVLQPAKEQALKLLAPLLAYALPEPLYTGSRENLPLSLRLQKYFNPLPDVFYVRFYSRSRTGDYEYAIYDQGYLYDLLPNEYVAAKAVTLVEHDHLSVGSAIVSASQDHP